jgi:ATP phosphoribosyltransferase
MNPNRPDIRLALPSKGQLADRTLEFLKNAGLRVHKPNPRQFEASIPAIQGLKVLFQRAADIPLSVRAGSVDFGITGWDVTAERVRDGNGLLPLLEELGYGHCALHVIVPEAWDSVHRMADLAPWQQQNGGTLRIATKFPNLSAQFLSQHGLNDFHLIHADGTLEAAPAIGYADAIIDLVSTGTTLRDNRLRRLEDGQILTSQACLIANRPALKTNPEVLQVARQLLEILVARLRAEENVSVFANMRGESPESLAASLFQQKVIGGLQGPTISQVFTPGGDRWYAVNIVVRKTDLFQAIQELRNIGGSGVVVSPITYIFEEEPTAYQAMLTALET